MKRMLITVIIFMFGMLMTNRLAADDAADVEAAFTKTLAAWNEGNLDEFVVQFFPDVKGYFMDGSPLSMGVTKENLQPMYESGFKPDVIAEDIDIKVYGNAAVLTAYFAGSVTWPGGEKQEAEWRFSEVRVKQDGKWLVVMYHISPLIEMETEEE